ncbi:hypothetical protein BZA05DRAFT_416202 [Tricharina praecox]|uniref:uncharacterized protein n=1 Tax=Tricharina praecox TaxID=43433 RepID=UPI0022200B05|nr:uncharacterized protein BZA05DRAFT_416202 [Tricharina praecox]KAI5856542.1 hypothetical protein BZA05DRAFT_416202 [Tricharina praecox]
MRPHNSIDTILNGRHYPYKNEDSKERQTGCVSRVVSHDPHRLGSSVAGAPAAIATPPNAEEAPKDLDPPKAPRKKKGTQENGEDIWDFEVDEVNRLARSNALSTLGKTRFDGDGGFHVGQECTACAPSAIMARIKKKTVKPRYDLRNRKALGAPERRMDTASPAGRRPWKGFTIPAQAAGGSGDPGVEAGAAVAGAKLRNSHLLHRWLLY